MTELWAFFTGPWEWIIVVVVAVLLFGRRLPEVGRSLGRGIVEFKKGVKEVEEDIKDASDPTSGGPEPPDKDKPPDAEPPTAVRDQAAPPASPDKTDPSDQPPGTPAG